MIACYYLDASALVKRYTLEAGRAWIIELTNPGSDRAVLLSEITLATADSDFTRMCAVGAGRREPTGAQRPASGTLARRVGQLPLLHRRPGGGW